MPHAAARLRDTVHHATRGLIDREQLAELMLLAAVAGEHLLVVGPPGTAKSAVVRRVAAGLGGRYFEYLLGRFTEPSELFGPIDLRRLREGRVEADVQGMLPEADVAFLDEVFLGSTAILNTLLGVLNERRFRRGHTDIACPLRVCVAAANGLPEDPALAAFADRFMLRLFVGPVSDDRLELLLEGGWASESTTLPPSTSLADLDLLATRVPQVDMSRVRPRLAQELRRLRADGLELSDRRIVKTQRLVAAAAVLAGRESATAADLWPLMYVLPTAEAQRKAQDLLRDSLLATANPILRSAAEAAVLQPRSREDRLLQAAQECLQADAAERGRRAEAVLREIDANFTRAALGPELAAARGQLAEQVSADA